MDTPGAVEPRSPRWSRGFTLIEVLAALIIVGLGMLGVIQAVIQSANHGTYLREKTLAHWIAMNLVTERRLMTSPPEVGTSSDVVEYAGQRWRWTVKVSETAVESMHRFDVSVGFADAPENETLATAIGFYGTAIAPAGSSNVQWDGRPGGQGPRPGQDGQQAGDGKTKPPADAEPEPEPEADPAEGDEEE
jgi:general secretion pathway protein I